MDMTEGEKLRESDEFYTPLQVLKPFLVPSLHGELILGSS